MTQNPARNTCPREIRHEGGQRPEETLPEKGNEGMRKRQRAQTPCYPMGPSPSPDMPRKTRRQEDTETQEDWPPLTRRAELGAQTETISRPPTNESPPAEHAVETLTQDPQALEPPWPEEVHHSCLGSGPLSLISEVDENDMPFRWPAQIMRPYKAMLVNPSPFSLFYS